MPVRARSAGKELEQQPIMRRPEATEPRLIHKLNHRLAPEILRQIVADYQAGKSSNQWMGEYRLGKGTVLRVLHEHGLCMHGGGIQTQRRRPQDIHRRTNSQWARMPLGGASDATTRVPRPRVQMDGSVLAKSGSSRYI